jgi:toxin CcdB
MPQFDVYRNDGGHVLVDCQADLLSHLSSRFVVPLIDPDSGLRRISRLNPVFEIEGRELIFFTQYATSLPVGDLGRLVTSLRDEHFRIMGAIDMLLSGY